MMKTEPKYLTESREEDLFEQKIDAAFNVNKHVN